jgi:hypothetical protein
VAATPTSCQDDVVGPVDEYGCGSGLGVICRLPAAE